MIFLPLILFLKIILKKPLIPARLKCWAQYKRMKKKIFSKDYQNIMTQEASILLALSFEPSHNVCFWYPGVYSLLSASRYQWENPLRYFSTRY